MYLGVRPRPLRPLIFMVTAQTSFRLETFLKSGTDFDIWRWSVFEIETLLGGGGLDKERLTLRLIFTRVIVSQALKIHKMHTSKKIKGCLTWGQNVAMRNQIVASTNWGFPGLIIALIIQNLSCLFLKRKPAFSIMHCLLEIRLRNIEIWIENWFKTEIKQYKIEIRQTEKTDWEDRLTENG